VALGLTLRVFENRVLDIRGRKQREAGKGCIMRSLIICMLHQILVE
jgi:hypothetical protein